MDDLFVLERCGELECFRQVHVRSQPQRTRRQPIGACTSPLGREARANSAVEDGFEGKTATSGHLFELCDDIRVERYCCAHEGIIAVSIMLS